MLSETISRWPQEYPAVERFAPLRGREVCQALRKSREIHWSLIVDEKVPEDRMADRNRFRSLHSFDLRALLALDLTKV